MIPSGYKLVQAARGGKGKGGGVAVVYNDSIKCSQIKIQSSYTTFEHLSLKFSVQGQHTNLLLIYRPPKSTSIFFDEFGTHLDLLTTIPGRLLILGDFNFHIDNMQNRDAQKFLSLLDAHGLIQHICEPTHFKGHILDLVMTRQDELSVRDITLDSSIKSDHFAILFKTSIKVPARERKQVTFRKWKEINVEDFKQELSTPLSDYQELSVSQCLELYNTASKSAVDKHAPERTCTATTHKNAPWYDKDVRREKRNRRKLEKQFRATGLTVHKQLHDAQRNHVNTLIETKKSEFFTDALREAKGQKDVFNISNRLLHKQKDVLLPSCQSPKQLSDRFSEFFAERIINIRSELEHHKNVDTNVGEEKRFSVSLSQFKPTTEAEVRSLIVKSPDKTCSLDPMPTWLLKQSLDSVLPLITHIINKSFTEAEVPQEMKEAVVKPLLKKPNLDSEVLKNYRPVSNLSYLSKLTERVVAARLKEHMSANNCHETLQSAYRTNHSTETALLKVQNDLLKAVDTDGAAVLVLLDLSAAFDTIDHGILLRTLQHRIGVTGKAVEWISSYMSQRYQSVCIDGHMSEKKELVYGVPQGSVLGPVLFTIYTCPLGDIARQYSLSFHLYADDTQLYLTFKPTDQSSGVHAFLQIQNCVEHIKAWMTSHFLKLNEDKTELMIICPKKTHWQYPLPSFHIGNCVIPISAEARNLGVIFDSSLSLESHVNTVCRRSYFHIRNIGLIRRYLDKHAVVSLVQAYVTSRVDYCNSLLYGLPSFLIKRLQKVQNTAARVVSGRKKYDHIQPVLQELHWLPVQYRIQYKLLVLVFQSLHNRAPEYLSSLLVRYQPPRSLRSCDKSLLVVPPVRTKTFGDRSFERAGPYLWNSLPLDLRSEQNLSTFKTKLKTFYYNMAFY